MAKFTALLPIIKGIGFIASTVSAVKSLSSSKSPKLPEAKLPIIPAPNAQNDLGINTYLGTEQDVKNQRVSGRSTVRASGATQDILGGLGSSGLSV